MTVWKGEEFVEEFEWLVRNGMSMLMASGSLGRKPETSSRMFRRYGRPDLACAIDRELSWPNKAGRAHD